MEEMEQMAFVKDGAKPHWGRIGSEWSDEILFGRESSKYDGCALEGIACVQKTDIVALPKIHIISPYIHAFSNTLLLLILCFLVITWTVRSVPPQLPVQCDQTGCTVSNTYGVWPDRTNCKAAKVAYPTTEEELIKAVAYASEHNLKVKTVTKFSSTIAKLACPSGSDAMLISTSKYNSVIEIEPERLTIKADSGVSLRELIDKVEAAGFSIRMSPYWEGVSIGGLISTGSHGSSWSGRGGSVHDHVVGINLVVPATSSEGYAKVVSIEEGR
ncbi:hypothetical protein Bca52824_037048 [Brassica carinata]|uniref:FAD-binding PCMH-type domain-containing protein n=1 Tax=Brassica carinata TaxID=52824 RepID=A0A8X7V5L4_BRACI|nr:hypothetical protein Bca52824_037048 [Brassica carinata]